MIGNSGAGETAMHNANTGRSVTGKQRPTKQQTQAHKAANKSPTGRIKKKPAQQMPGAALTYCGARNRGNCYVLPVRYSEQVLHRFDITN